MTLVGRGTLSATTPAGRRFQFLQEIASGGFGSVYVAKMLPPIPPPGVRETRPGELVAVKLLHRQWSDNAEIGSRMRDEARLLSKLRHENIVEVLDFVSLDGRSAIVMELLEAVDTRVIIEYCTQAGERVPLSVALEIMACVASALDAAYNRPPTAGGRPLRVIHRDIKPSNIMVDGQGRVKVLDFGVARAEFDTREAKTAELAFGSLEYMPPERLFFEPESAASDVYSLGTALYELLALEHLGKAKLRLSEQEKFLTERLADLLERYPVAIPDDALRLEVETRFVELMKGMLAFDEATRPTAQQAAEQMRALAALAGPPTLAEWAKVAIPPLVDAAREATHSASSGTLTGQTVTEDPLGEDGLSRQDIADQADTLLQPASLQQTELLGPVTATEDRTVRDDTRWNALKKATLASLSETNEMGPLVVEEARRQRPVSPLEWLDNDEDLEGAPTVRMVTATPPPRPRSAAPASTPLSGQNAAGQGAQAATAPALGQQDTALRGGALAISEAAVAATAPTGPMPLESGNTTELLLSPDLQIPPSELDTVLHPAPGAILGTMGGDLPMEEAAKRPPSAPPPPARAAPSFPPPSQGQPSYPPQSYPPPHATPIPASAGYPSGTYSRVSLTGPPSGPYYPVPEAELSGASSLGYLISAGMLLATSVVIFSTVMFVGAVGIAAMSQSPPRSETPLAPIQAPGQTAMQQIAPLVPPGTAPAGAHFVSNMAETHRMVVRCEGAEGKGASGTGTTEVLVPGSRFSECTVTAVDTSRRRRTAVITNVKARSYQCFVGTESTCR